jgi:phosphoenolpyruvate synthase/pyruvate phosphate dikinase
LSKSKFILDKTVTDLESMLSSRLEIEEGAVSVYRGHPIYPGAASGKLFVDFDAAIDAKRKKEKVIFYVDDISQLTLNEVKEMRKFDGILFRRVAFENHQTIDLQRSGVPMMRVDDLKYNTKKEGFFAKKEITEYVLGHFSFTSEHPISINSATGQVYFGQNKVLPSQIVPTNLDIGKPEVREYVSIMDTVDKVLSDMNLEIMINADNVEQILEARKWGATSIGLVRSENILRENETNLFSYGRLLHSLLTINKLWQDEEVVKKTGFPFNKKIEAVMKSFDSSQKEFGKVQEDAFYNILKTQNGKRTQIRLLDPSLSELFSESDVGNIIDSTGVL